MSLNRWRALGSRRVVAAGIWSHHTFRRIHGWTVDEHLSPFFKYDGWLKTEDRSFQVEVDLAGVDPCVHSAELPWVLT